MNHLSNLEEALTSKARKFSGSAGAGFTKANPENVIATSAVSSTTGVTTCTYNGNGFVENSACQSTGYNLRVFPTRVSGVRQMSLNNADANVARDFHVAGRLNVEASFLVFNLFNHIDLGAPNTSVTSNQFG